MNFILEDVQGNRLIPQKIDSFELTQTVGVPCDSLRLYFSDRIALPEVCSVFVLQDHKRIFNGICDTQSSLTDGAGVSHFIYARSSAALLVDSEAAPATFCYPTSAQLFAQYIRDKGFTNGLNEVFCQDSYEVTKGTSCYGAVNDFVSLIHGTGIYVTPDNVLKLYETSGAALSLNHCRVLSVKSTVNRGDVFSCIDYKINGDDCYIYHMKSKTAAENQIKRTRLLNLASLPVWQREYSARSKLASSFEDYRTLQVTASGIVNPPLFSRLSFSSDILGSFDRYLLYEKTVACNSAGTVTKLTLKQETDMKEINYVAE